MPTIRIDNDVYSWLKSQAIPFEDTPNSVLRRISMLGNNNINGNEAKKPLIGNYTKNLVRANGTQWTGERLKDIWEVDAVQTRYHKDGTWFENLTAFPGALFDANGYVLFHNEKDYKQCSYLRIGKKLNVHKGISTIPGYKRMQIKIR